MMNQYLVAAVLAFLAVGTTPLVDAHGAGGMNRSGDVRSRHTRHAEHVQQQERQLDLGDLVESIARSSGSPDPISAVLADIAAVDPTTSTQSTSVSSAPASSSSDAPVTSTESAAPTTTFSTSEAASTTSVSVAETTSSAAETSSAAPASSSAPPAPTTTSAAEPTTSTTASVASTTAAETSSSVAEEIARSTSSAGVTTTTQATSASESSVASESSAASTTATTTPTTTSAASESSAAAVVAEQSSSAPAEESKAVSPTSKNAEEASATTATADSQAPASSTTAVSAQDTSAASDAAATTAAASTSAKAESQAAAEPTTSASTTVAAQETSTFSADPAQETAASQTRLITTSAESSPSATPTESASSFQETLSALLFGESSSQAAEPTSQGAETSAPSTESGTGSVAVAQETSSVAQGSASEAQATETASESTTNSPSPSPIATATATESAFQSTASSATFSQGAASSVAVESQSESGFVSATATASATFSADAPVVSESVSVSETIFGSASASYTESAALPFASESIVANATASAFVPVSSTYTDVYTESAVPSSSASSSDTNDVWYPTQSQLLMPLAAVTTSSESSRSYVVPTGTDSSYIPVPTVAPIPLNLPSVILPAADSQKAGTDQAMDHAEDSLVSLLFSDALAWTFVANNSEATAQVMLYTPILVETALALNESGATTYALKAYQPASINGVVSPVLTTWVGYVPKTVVADLQAQIKASNSAFYNQSGIPGELAMQVNKAYPIVTSFSSNTGSSSGAASSGSSLSSRNRDIIIGVTVSIGGALWILLVVWVYRKMRRNAKADIHRRMSMNPTLTGRALANVNLMTSGDSHNGSTHARSSSVDIDARPSSFYAFSPPSASDRASARPQSRDGLASIKSGSPSGGAGNAIGSGRLSTIYRALGGGAAASARPTSPESPMREQQNVAPSMTRRRGPAPAPPINYHQQPQHVLSDPANPFSNPIADTYQQSSWARLQAGEQMDPPAPYQPSRNQPSPFYGGASGGKAVHNDPFADSNRVQRTKPFQAQDISGPVLRESSLGF